MYLDSKSNVQAKERGAFPVLIFIQLVKHK